MAEQEPQDVGRKGGSAEGFLGAHPYAGRYYYEPTATAVTDIVVPATRIQWGPVFAGLLIAMAVTFLFTALGMAIGLSASGLGYWVVGFASLGLFLGSLYTARTAKADVLPAIMHGIINWSLFMIVTLFAFGNIAGTIAAAVVGELPATPQAAPLVEVARNVGWWFFGGFLILLAASILGGLAGVNPPETREEETAPPA